MVSSTRLTQHDGSPHVNSIVYRKLIGKFIYLINTRPDICYAMQQLSQFLETLTQQQLRAAHKVLIYRKGTSAHGVHYHFQNFLVFKTFNDYNWATCPDSRKPIIGFRLFRGHAFRTWKSKK